MHRIFCFLVLWLSVGLPASAPALEPLSDPTRPPAVFDIPEAFEPGSPDALRLSAVLISPERRLAVINGRHVVPGDEIAGAYVVRINPWGVMLDDSGETLELRLSRRTTTSAAPLPEEP